MEIRFRCQFVEEEMRDSLWKDSSNADVLHHLCRINALQCKSSAKFRVLAWRSLRGDRVHAGLCHQHFEILHGGILAL